MAVPFSMPLLEGKVLFFLRRDNPGRIPLCRSPHLRIRQTSPFSLRERKNFNYPLGVDASGCPSGYRFTASPATFSTPPLTAVALPGSGGVELWAHGLLCPPINSCHPWHGPVPTTGLVPPYFTSG